MCDKKFGCVNSIDKFRCSNSEYPCCVILYVIYKCLSHVLCSYVYYFED